MKIHLAVLGTLAALLLPLAGQEPLPQPGSKEWRDLFDPPYTKPTELPLDHPLRKQLFDQLRKNVQGKEPVKFQGNLEAYRNWALFTGQGIDTHGKPMPFPPMDNSDAVALWLRTEAGWILVEHSVGHSDAFYTEWSDKYDMPHLLFGSEPPAGKESIPHEIPMSSPLRKQLFDLLRPKTTMEAAQELRFQGSLKTHNNWAFFHGRALDTKDKPIVFPEGNSSDIVALWLETESGWKLIASATGVTDAFYLEWQHQYGVTRSLLESQ